MKGKCHKMPGSALKAGARKLIFKNSPRLLIISIMYVVFITVVSEFSFRLPFGNIVQDMTNQLAVGELPNIDVIFTGYRPVGLILALLLSFLRPLLNFGFMSFCLKTSRSQNTDVKDLFNGFLFFTKVISIFFITSVLIFLWSLLLVIPGIVASYRYRQAYYILLDDPGKGALQCIMESGLMMHGKKLDLLILDISFLGWYLLDVIVGLLIPLPFAIPIISIWLSPYIGLTRFAFYENQVSNVAV